MTTIVSVICIFITYFIGRFVGRKLLINDIVNDLEQFSKQVNLEQFKKHLQYKYNLIQ